MHCPCGMMARTQQVPPRRMSEARYFSWKTGWNQNKWSERFTLSVGLIRRMAVSMSRHEARVIRFLFNNR